jgi:hypothetical protein
MAKLIDGVMKGRPARTPEQVETDFLSRFVKRPSGCWEWTGTIEKRGYGVLQIEKKQWRAHRYSYIRTYGHVPDDVLICHKCNNKLCVNPEHLYKGTHRDNMDDVITAGVQKGVNNGRARLTEADVLEIRRLYATKKYTQNELAIQFNVYQSRISDIVTLTQWKHLK